MYCDGCWRSRCVLRAITVPVASPLDCDWKELRLRLREMWASTTQASNWMLTELYARDVRRTTEEKMPAMARVYLYPETRQRFPALPAQTCAALEQAVQAKYRAVRYKLIWTAEVSLPTHRYPTPFPIPNQGWGVEIENECPVVSLRIGDTRLRLRLRGGARFRRQRAAIEQMADGSATRGEIAIYQQGEDIMVKMVAWLPRDAMARRQRDQRTGTLVVRTDPERMIVALNMKDEKLWEYHGDHILRWSVEHRAQLQRWADDTKAEHRPVPPFAERREQAAKKYRHRMQSAAHQLAAMIAGYAARRKFAGVKYDDGQQDYCPQFPWFRLRELIAEKLDAAGIEFEHAPSAPKKEEQPVGA